MKPAQIRAEMLGFLFTVLKVWILLPERHCVIQITHQVPAYLYIYISADLRYSDLNLILQSGPKRRCAL